MDDLGLREGDGQGIGGRVAAIRVGRAEQLGGGDGVDQEGGAVTDPGNGGVAVPVDDGHDDSGGPALGRPVGIGEGGVQVDECSWRRHVAHPLGRRAGPRNRADAVGHGHRQPAVAEVPPVAVVGRLPGQSVADADHGRRPQGAPLGAGAVGPPPGTGGRLADGGHRLGAGRRRGASQSLPAVAAGNRIRLAALYRSVNRAGQPGWRACSAGPAAPAGRRRRTRWPTSSRSTG